MKMNNLLLISLYVFTMNILAVWQISDSFIVTTVEMDLCPLLCCHQKMWRRNTYSRAISDYEDGRRWTFSALKEREVITRSSLSPLYLTRSQQHHHPQHHHIKDHSNHVIERSTHQGAVDDHRIDLADLPTTQNRVGMLLTKAINMVMSIQSKTRSKRRRDSSTIPTDSSSDVLKTYADNTSSSSSSSSIALESNVSRYSSSSSSSSSSRSRIDLDKARRSADVLRSTSLSFSAGYKRSFQLNDSYLAVKYLSLPASEYSLLDTSLVSRSLTSPNDTFDLTLPVGDIFSAYSILFNSNSNNARTTTTTTSSSTTPFILKTSITVRPDPTRGRVLMSSGPLYFEPSSSFGVISSTGIGRDGSNRGGVIGAGTIPSVSLEADSSIHHWSLPEWLIWGGSNTHSSPSSSSSASSKIDRNSSSSFSDHNDNDDDDNGDNSESVNDPQQQQHKYAVKSSIQAGFKMELIWDASRVKQRQLEVRRVDKEKMKINMNSNKSSSSSKYIQPQMGDDASNVFKTRATVTRSTFNDDDDKNDIDDDELDSLRLHPLDISIPASRQELQVSSLSSPINSSVGELHIHRPSIAASEALSTSQSIIVTTNNEMMMIPLGDNHPISVQLKVMMLWFRAATHRLLINCKIISFWIKVIVLRYWKRCQGSELYQIVIQKEEVMRILHQASLLYDITINLVRKIVNASQPLLLFVISLSIHIQKSLSLYVHRHIRPRLHEETVLRWLLDRSNDIHHIVAQLKKKMMMEMKMMKKMMMMKMVHCRQYYKELMLVIIADPRHRAVYQWMTACFIPPFQSMLAFIHKSSSSISSSSSSSSLFSKAQNTVAAMIVSNSTAMIPNNSNNNDNDNNNKVRWASHDDIIYKVASLDELNNVVVSNEMKTEQTGFDDNRAGTTTTTTTTIASRTDNALVDSRRIHHHHHLLKSNDNNNDDDDDMGAVTYINIADDNTTLSVTAKIDVWVALNLPLQEDLSKALTLLPVKLLLSQAGSITTSAVLKATTPRFIDLLLQDYYKRREEIS